MKAITLWQPWASLITMREVMEREVYKTARYIKYIDIDGKDLPANKYFGNATVLYFGETDDGGLVVKLLVYNLMPEGWKTIFGAMTAPNGFKWICNGKSIFNSEYEKALLRL